MQFTYLVECLSTERNLYSNTRPFICFRLKTSYQTTYFGLYFIFCFVFVVCRITTTLMTLYTIVRGVKILDLDKMAPAFIRAMLQHPDLTWCQHPDQKTTVTM